MSNKLKEHGLSQDELGPCLLIVENLDVCIGVHVDDLVCNKVVGLQVECSWTCGCTRKVLSW